MEDSVEVKCEGASAMVFAVAPSLSLRGQWGGIPEA